MAAILWLEGVTITKDPDDVKSYPINFVRELQAKSITSLTVEPDESTGLNVDSSSFSGKIVTFTLSGGNPSRKGRIEITMSLDTGEDFNRSVFVEIKEL